MSADFRNTLRTVDSAGHRLWVYADIFGKGSWRQKRRGVAAFLVMLYLMLPWFTIKGLPVIQIDINGHKIIAFGQIFWLHEAGMFLPFIFGLLFLLFAVTARYGRIWCGWGCPQTVFLEFIYRPIERWIEGRPMLRRQLDQQRMNFQKFKIKLLKWAIYSAISFVIANSFLAYFIGARTLIQVMTQNPAENPGAFGMMVLVYAGFMFNFGYFREQMCTITCPYGRLQSILFDRRTKIVGYDFNRGEPRRGSAGLNKSQLGDCVNCMRCVQVCPTGIDIRDGLQLECIGCMSCSDACNEVMTKLKKPLDLIGYTSELKLKRVENKKRSARSLAYGAFSFVLLTVAFVQLFTRTTFDVEIARSGAVQFQDLGARIQNSTQFTVENKSTQPIEIAMSTDRTDADLIIPEKKFTISPQQKKSFMGFEILPRAAFTEGESKFQVVFENLASGEKKRVTLTLFGPQS